MGEQGLSQLKLEEKNIIKVIFQQKRVTRKEIAEKLNCSESLVKKYLRKIYEKLAIEEKTIENIHNYFDFLKA